MGSPTHLLRLLDTHHHGRGHCLQTGGIIMGCRRRAFLDCTHVIINLLNTSECSIRPRTSPSKMAPNSLDLLFSLEFAKHLTFLLAPMILSQRFCSLVVLFEPSYKRHAMIAEAQVWLIIYKASFSLRVLQNSENKGKSWGYLLPSEQLKFWSHPWAWHTWDW